MVVHKGITLTVGAQAVVDFSLPVGQQQQTVTVEGEATVVETTNAAVGTSTSEQQMRELPLNGRNFEQLIQLAPGVATVQFANNAMQGRAAQYSVAGSRPEGQSIMLDDENLQSFWNNGISSISGSSLGVEAIAEFQTLTNSFSAQFGGNGAVINAVSRVGNATAFHGSAFDFLRNSDLDARDFFLRTRSSPPPFRRNQFGGSLGGPVMKDKAFFFVDYEGIRQLLQQFGVATVPNCTAGFASGPCQITATNPTTAAAIANTLSLYPAPQVLQTPTAASGQATTFGNRHGSRGLRVDPVRLHVLGEGFHFCAVFLRQDFRTIAVRGSRTIGRRRPASLLARNGQFPVAIRDHRGAAHYFAHSGQLSDDQLFAAHQKFRRTHSRHGAERHHAFAVFRHRRWCGGWFYQLHAYGLTPLGPALGTGHFTLAENRYAIGDDLLWTHGAHSIRMGFCGRPTAQQQLEPN